MTISHPKFKAAAVQAAPVYFDLDATIAKAVDMIEEAARNGASLIAFPETWIPGYPWWIWLETPAGGMKFAQTYHDNSLPVDSPQMDRLKAAARDNGIYVAMGYSERAAGSLFMSQCLIDDAGAMVFARRKLKPTLAERMVYGDGDGSDFRVADTDLGRIGALCCWEHLQPLSKYAMYASNEQVHVAAWPAFSMYNGIAYALGHEVNNAASRVYAVEGQCFVIAPCALITPEVIDMMADTDEKRAMVRAGGGYAKIFGPDGSELAETIPEDQEGILYADIDLSLITLSKVAADPAGHYSRPDVTRLVLDRRPKPRMQEITADADLDHTADVVETEL